VKGQRFDLEITPGQRFDLAIYWQEGGTDAPIPLTGWTPMLVIEQNNQFLYSNAGPEPDFLLTKHPTDVGRMDLLMGFEFTSQFYLPFDGIPQLHYFLELVDDTLNANTVPLLWGAVPIRARYAA
jgi:hypothetical protein